MNGELQCQGKVICKVHSGSIVRSEHQQLSIIPLRGVGFEKLQNRISRPRFGFRRDAIFKVHNDGICPSGESLSEAIGAICGNEKKRMLPAH